MNWTLVSLAALGIGAIATAPQASAQEPLATSGEYCNQYAADIASGGRHRAYSAAEEGAFLAAYRDCMRAYQIMLPVKLLPLNRDEVEIVPGADIEAENKAAFFVEDWSADRHAYCAAKYRSYNPDTGLYLTYAGAWKPCR